MDRGSQLSKDDEDDEDDKDDKDDKEEEERRTRQEEAEEEEEEQEEEEEATDIKSNNPHLAGGEKQLCQFAEGSQIGGAPGPPGTQTDLRGHGF